MLEIKSPTYTKDFTVKQTLYLQTNFLSTQSMFCSSVLLMAIQKNSWKAITFPKI